METYILYVFSLLCFGIRLSETSDLKPVECNASISRSQTAELPQVLLKAEHSYSSVTNGNPYSKEPKFVGSVNLGGNVTSASLKVEVTNSHLQTVTFAYNGTHICSSAQLRLETDTCWAGSSSGCFNKTNTCDDVCFRAKDFYERHTLRLFRSSKASSSIGKWSMSDYVTVYTTPSKQLMCFYGAESYENWDNRPASYPSLTKMLCPTGQRCRVTTGKYMLSSPIETFIGCETDSNQYGGCEEGCSWRKYHQSPSGSRKQWAHMCKYCCSENLCNDPFKCKNLNCDLSLDSSSEPPPNIAYSFLYRSYSININIVTTSLAVCYLYFLEP